MHISTQLKARLLKLGVSTLHPGEFSLPDAAVFEPPCSIKWMNATYSLRLGAFSYAVSGYYFGAQIGRYTSIGEEVQVGRGSHPISWPSTSPLFYQRHTDVFDFFYDRASAFHLNAPYIEPKPTIIGNDVYIGHGAFVIQGVTVGDGAVVGACSVVTKDVPAYAIVGGAPAVVRKMRFPDPIIERMLALRWWKFAFWDLSGIPADDASAFLDFVERRGEEGITPYKPRPVVLSELRDETET